MLVLALDLATKCGVALGSSMQGRPSYVDVWDLSKTKPLGRDAIHRGPGALFIRLRFLFKEHGIPDFAIIEQMMRPRGQHHEAVIVSQGDLHGAAKAVMGGWNIPFITPHCSTVRKHYCGRASAGSREATKDMVVRRAKQLGHLAYGETSDDKGDACALWDYGVHVHLRQPAPSLVLYGG